MNRNMNLLGIALVWACLAGAPAHAATIDVYAHSDDGGVRESSDKNTVQFDGLGDTFTGDGNFERRVGSYNASFNNNAGPAAVGKASEDEFIVYPFALPALPAGEMVGSASVTFWLEEIIGTPDFDVSLWALDRVSAASTPLASDYEGSGTLLKSDFATTASTEATTFSGNSLASFLNDAYDSNAAGDYVFLRLSRSDGGAFAGGLIEPNTAFEFGTVDNNSVFRRPKLTIETTVIPEPASVTLVLVGTGLLAMRRRR
jgi:hypothetical protein